MRMRVFLLISLAVFSAILGCGGSPKVVKTCRIIAVDSASVWEQTRAHYRVEYDSTGAGVFVKSIDGVAQSRAAFWLFYVNDRPGTVSCEEFIPAAGDTIEWRLLQNH